MTLPTDYIDGDVLTAADVNAITTAVNSNTSTKLAVGTFNAKGDLLVGLTNDSVGVLSVGTNGYLLSASSGATAGVAWIPSGGKVLGFASTEVTTGSSTNSLSKVDITGLSVTYTPASATSNLVVDLYIDAEVARTAGSPGVRKAEYRLYEAAGSSDCIIGQELPAGSSDREGHFSPVSIRKVYASTGTSARTFKGQFSVLLTDLTAYVNNLANGKSTITVTEIST